MSLRAPRCISLFFSLSIALATGCGGSDGASLFPNPTPDAGPTPDYDAGGFGAATDASDGAPAVPCTPQPLGSFKPAWHPPNGAHQNVCTTQQTSDFFDNCLTPPIDPTTCAAYVGQNGVCAACLQSEETAATYGPVVWHAHDSFFTLNIPGCIAIEQSDSSASSCAAAYQAELECKEGACAQCFASGDSSFALFSTCEGEASTECASYQTALDDTCSPEFQDANVPAAVCLPPASTATKDVYLTFAPLFCGQ